MILCYRSFCAGTTLLAVATAKGVVHALGEGVQHPENLFEFAVNRAFNYDSLTRWLPAIRCTVVVFFPLYFLFCVYFCKLHPKRSTFLFVNLCTVHNHIITLYHRSLSVVSV